MTATATRLPKEKKLSSGVTNEKQRPKAKGKKKTVIIKSEHCVQSAIRHIGVSFGTPADPIRTSQDPVTKIFNPVVEFDSCASGRWAWQSEQKKC